MRRTVALIVLGLVAWAAVPAPAAANLVQPPMTRPHMPPYMWNGVQQACERYVWVFDRTGDQTIASAMQEFTLAYYNDAARRGLAGCGGVPIFLYHHDHAEAGICGPFQGPVLHGYSFVTVCAKSTGQSTTYLSSQSTFGHNFILGGPGQVSTNAHHPYSYIRSGNPYNGTFTGVAHEMMHMLGVGHTSHCADLMAGGEYGCSIPLTEKRYLSEADWDALRLFYTGHPPSPMHNP